MKYIPIKSMMWRIIKYPQLKNITIEEVAEFSEDLLRLLNIPQSLITEVEEFTVKDYKITLPSCLESVLGVRIIEGDCMKALNYSANNYHKSERGKDDNCHKDNTYIVQGCNIITSFEKGLIEVSYKKLPVDDEGYPLIPDNESFKKALEYDIRLRYLEPIWEMGRVTDKAFQRVQQERDWYVGQAQSKLIQVGYDQMDMMIKGVNKLIVDTRPKETFWIGHGKTEKIKRHD